MKVDIFVAGRTPLDEEELQRRRLVPVSADASRQLYVAVAEDLILKVQGPTLNRKLLDRWASRLGLDDLLRRALTESGGPAHDDR